MTWCGQDFDSYLERRDLYLHLKKLLSIYEVRNEACCIRGIQLQATFYYCGKLGNSRFRKCLETFPSHPVPHAMWFVPPTYQASLLSTQSEAENCRHAKGSILILLSHHVCKLLHTTSRSTYVLLKLLCQGNLI